MNTSSNPSECAKGSDYERIWLEGRHEAALMNGRQWCSANEWADDTDFPPTEYVRADLAAAPTPAIAGGGLREAVRALELEVVARRISAMAVRVPSPDEGTECTVPYELIQRLDAAIVEFDEKAALAPTTLTPSDGCKKSSSGLIAQHDALYDRWLSSALSSPSPAVPSSDDREMLPPFTEAMREAVMASGLPCYPKHLQAIYEIMARAALASEAGR